MYQHASRFPAWMLDCPADLHDEQVMQQATRFAPDTHTACVIAAAIEEAIAERMRS
jgi:hypothetical protein